MTASIKHYFVPSQALRMYASVADNLQAMLKGGEAKQLGSRVQKRAEELKISAAAIAAECHVTTSAVYQWYKNGRIAKKHLVKLAQLLRWTVRDILGEPFPIQVNPRMTSIRAQYLAEMFDSLPEAEQLNVWPALLKLLGKPVDGNGDHTPNAPRRPKPVLPRKHKH